MFPSDEVRKKVLYHVGIWLMVMLTVVYFSGNPDNELHSDFLDFGFTLLQWLVVGVVLNSGVEVAMSKRRGE